MKLFLERIASHIYDNYGTSLENQYMVFPGRRAALFFLMHLGSSAGKPVWAPHAITINELFTSFSELRIAEPETLIFELYSVYRELNSNAESFDSFYHWGEMIINDFDDVDKYLADSSKVFSNLADLKKIDMLFGELTPEQVAAVRKFWVNFNSGGSTREKSGFLGLWSILPVLYEKFRSRLMAKGLAYEGMVFRDVALRIQEGSLRPPDGAIYHFVGFNALNMCERTMMGRLRESGIAKFYWDYDISYTMPGTDHSAGFFIRNNLKDFGNDMPPDWDYSTLYSSPHGSVRRRIIDAPGDIAQVKLVPGILDDLKESYSDESCSTAIIMADESLLLPLLSTIPEKAGNINITMGFPIRFSQVYKLIRDLLELQITSVEKDGKRFFDHKIVFSILRNSSVSVLPVTERQQILKELTAESSRWIDCNRFMDHETLGKIFEPAENPGYLPVYLRKVLSSLYVTDLADVKDDFDEREIFNEFIYRTVAAINRLEGIISDSGVSLSAATWKAVLDKVIRGLSIPFTGEPLSGLQVMGLLETRALDFRNLVILSVNEGVIPAGSHGSSYIPYTLREAFGLPTVRHQDSIYSYYFHRLLHRAEEITFIYNSSTEGIRTGEMSRFLMQMVYLGSRPPVISGVDTFISVRDKKVSEIKRTGKHSLIIQSMFAGKGGRSLYPSTVNTWLHCRMKFYYRYLCGLEQPERISESVDPAMFGTFLHEIMEKLYSGYKGETVTEAAIRSLLADRLNTEKIAAEIISENLGVREGSNSVIGSILASYVRLILLADMRYAPFTVVDLERKVSAGFEINGNGGIRLIRAGGVIDRLDISDGRLRIIDYKTGIVQMEIRSVGSLFDAEDEKRNEAWFQILMYSELLSEASGSSSIFPGVYPLRNLSDPSFTASLTIKQGKENGITVDDYSAIRREFRSALLKLLEEIVDENSHFITTSHKRKCDFCEFSNLCRR